MTTRRMELIAQGERPEQRWRRPVPSGTTFLLGRTTAAWAVPWDEKISRWHASLRRVDGGLEVTQSPEASNPVFVRGREVDVVIVMPGEHFVIGSTTFTLTEAKVMLSLEQPAPVAERRYSSADLRNVRYRDADQRIDALSRLPDLIQSASNDEDLFSRVVNVLLLGVPRGNCAAIVAKKHPGPHSPIEVLHWDSVLNAASFTPSEQLIRQVLDKRESVIHIWYGHAEETGFTQGENLDWAFCTPLPGSSCSDWAIYLTGNLPSDVAPGATDPLDFQDDLKFAESAAAMLGYLREIRQLARDKAALSQFFSPRVMEVVASSDPDVVLAPRESEVTVMFCDLRGFSLHADRSVDDLFGLLERVSSALGVMTRLILENGGVVGDFQGDSVMAFWGWPLPEPEGPRLACRTALGIMRAFSGLEGQTDQVMDAAVQVEQPFSGFRCGIGVATGRAVAGRIGTDDQVKFTAFGPVVNLASRLEGMTNFWHTPILLDDATAAAVKPVIVEEGGRLRALCTVQPKGMTQQVSLTELIGSSGHSPLSDGDLEGFADVLRKFASGDWAACRAACEALVATDEVCQVLLNVMEARGDAVPPEWDGVVKMSSK